MKKGKEMGMVIEEIKASNVKDVNKSDGEFVIDARIGIYVEDDVIRYEVLKIPSTTKKYEEVAEYTTYADDPEKTVFLAYVDGQIAGQIVLRKNWNNYAYIEDIVVDVKFRRQGIGFELIEQARKWARERKLVGFMLETQNNNVSACKFYERCGFQLGGFDRYLYSGINKDKEEVALYWYLFFGNG
jgi:ribosomal protein S18 acetylase RimI-like enzyme